MTDLRMPSASRICVRIQIRIRIQGGRAGGHAQAIAVDHDEHNGGWAGAGWDAVINAETRRRVTALGAEGAIPP